MFDEVYAVIGAGFGDEGKGLITDYLASEKSGSTLVVRYNGGAQAGHTVCTGDVRHVFSHFGSGTLAGCSTLLGPEFILNPLIWHRERLELGFRATDIFYHGGSMVTTPYDIVINRFIEQARGITKHGSCGSGIYETIHRCRSSEDFAVRASTKNPKLRLKNIRDAWLPTRLLHLGYERVPEGILDVINQKGFEQEWLDAFSDFIAKSNLVLPWDQIREYTRIIFEGAQGLLLDESHPRFYPHLTPTSTGLPYVLGLIGRSFGTGMRPSSMKELRTIYVMRSYLTRHGAGPFPSEDANLVFDDNTNNDGPWQGSLRFGHLDLDLIKEAIETDLHRNAGQFTRHYFRVNPRIAITHLDQFSPNVAAIERRLGYRAAYMSYGPNRRDVVDVSAMSRNWGVL